MRFEVIPAIDLKGGKCVQLVQGVKEDVLLSLDDPLEVAGMWIDEGAETLHIIDLDGAFGERSENRRIVYDILRLAGQKGVKTQVGGGIRTLKDAKGLLERGADRIIVATAALRNPDFIRILVERFAPERVMVALDARSGEVQVEGWTRGSGRSPPELAQLFESLGAGWILFTNIDVEGLMQGIILDPIVEILSAVNIPVLVAGGITTLEDIDLVKHSGASGVILGSALYRGKISLVEALKMVE
ncbi:MAG TPA: 1-(5-phosphoribosyl)-5-[(5-phosphoribosylamino)methylideneamino]imidazole-4-carboxamide isomerase [Candidatus Syntrophoarchaeum butanivorans]|nr:1-(5-phosphoribosyl)-5-[(5-phosphoribosylamino)methylideneamino]imidazole-4-carboxamide isomerase [Candidatus Syntrophoarchaeum butanivorans]